MHLLTPIHYLTIVVRTCYLLTLTCFKYFPGIVGEADENEEDYYLWTYKKLEIGFNGNRIVDVNLTSEGKVKLVPNTKIAMSYSVSIGRYVAVQFILHRTVPVTVWFSPHHIHVLTYISCFSQVKWKKSDVKFEDRFDKYLDPSFFQHRVS